MAMIHAPAFHPDRDPICAFAPKPPGEQTFSALQPSERALRSFKITIDVARATTAASDPTAMETQPIVRAVFVPLGW
jgi:hypothetical protein